MIKKKKKKGFTLIELITVLCLISIITAISLPSFYNETSIKNFVEISSLKKHIRYTQIISMKEEAPYGIDIQPKYYYLYKFPDKNTKIDFPGEKENIINVKSLKLVAQTFEFNDRGALDSGAPIQYIKISPNNKNILKIYKLTGFVEKVN